MPKVLLVLLTLIVIIFVAYFTLAINTRESKPSKIEQETVINQAKLLYKHTKEKGQDLSNGPCLSNALMPGWVLDIVHSPRQVIDDLPQNQCAAYIEGSAQHFVELDLDGNLIRVR